MCVTKQSNLNKLLKVQYYNVPYNLFHQKEQHY